jgi:hypothetical protein
MRHPGVMARKLDRRAANRARVGAAHVDADVPLLRPLMRVKRILPRKRPARSPEDPLEQLAPRLLDEMIPQTRRREHQRLLTQLESPRLDLTAIGRQLDQRTRIQNQQSERPKIRRFDRRGARGGFFDAG